MPFISVFKVGGGTGSSALILVTGSSEFYISIVLIFKIIEVNNS